MGPVEQGWVSSWPPGCPSCLLILPSTLLTIERTLLHDALKGLVGPFALLLDPVAVIWESNREK